MEAENRVVLEQFMSSSLVSWVRTFGRLGDKEGNVLSEFTELVDGLFLNKVMNQINPKATIQGLSKVNNNDMCQRAQNLCVLMYHIKSYYQDTLQQLIMMSPPNVLLMGRNPLSEESLMEIKKILLLLLGCAVQCERKEEYIEMIQNLDFDTKAAIATHIQEVTHSQENVFDLHWLEMEGLCPEEWENLSRNLIVSLKTVVDQRDRQFETLVELMQGKEWMKSAVFSGHPSLIESGQCQLSQQHLAQELAEAKAKVKCLRQELEEKSEHLLDCRQDIDNLDVELKRLQQENMQLLADARAARMYRDELDAMKERAIAADKLESEVSRYRDKLHSLNFYKAKLEELKEDNQVLMDSKTFLEDQLENSRARYEKLNHLEKHNVLLEAKLHDMEEEKAINRRHIEDLLEKNVVLELSQKRSMEESQRLGWELELAKSPQQNSGSVSEQKSLSQEVTEMTCSRLLKLEKENQRLLKTLEELQGVGCPLNGFNSNTGCFSRNGQDTVVAECPAENMKAGPANNQFFTQAEKNITQSTDTEHEHPHPPLENGTSTVQYPQLESHDNESLQDSVQSRQHRKALGKESGDLYEETTCLSETFAEKRKLERKNLELIQQAEIDKKMLNALREELLDQKLKIQLKESDLEKQTYELEKMKLNVEIRMGDNGLAKQGKRKILESSLESSLMKSLKMKKERMATLESRLQESFKTNQQLREDFKTVKLNYEAFLQRSEKGNEGHSSPPEKTWESHEATWALLKLKDRLIEVERNNATLEAEKQALHTQLQSVKTQSDGLQAQIIALQQQTASLQENCTSLQMLNAQLQVEKSSASSQNSSLMAHNSQLQRERQGLEVEREGIMREREDLRTVNELLLRDHERLSVLHERQAAELEVVSHRYSMMENSHRSLEIEHRSLEDRYNSLLQQRAQLEGLERALREEQQKMQSEICTHKSTTAEYQRLRDEKDWLNQTYQKLLAENEGLQVEHSHVKSQLISCNLEQTQMDSELRKLKEQNQHLDIAAIKLTNQCELLTQLKGNLEEENRHLLDQIQSLMLQNRSLLDQTMESKDLFHVEQRQYIDKLNDLRRQKEKLEEKIMDQYKFYEPSPTRRRGNWITLKMRKLMKTKTRDQEQGCSTAAQVDGLDDLHLPESSSLVESQGSEESTSNSLNDVPSPKRSGLTPLKIFHTKRKRPKDKEKVKSLFCRSLSLNDLFSVSGQQEEQEEHILQQNIALSNKHSTLWSSIHHFSSIDDHETILNKGSKFEGDESQQNFASEPDFQRNGVRDRPNRAPSASSGEYSISLENEAWSSDSSPLLDNSQQSRDTSRARPNEGDLSSDRRVRRSYSGRSYTDRSVKKDKDNNGLCKTQSVYGSEVETKPTLESQGKSSSASGCLNCFAPPVRSPKPGQAFSTLPRASSVISTSEGNSRRASTSSGLSLGSGTNKTTARASFIQPDTKEDGLKASHVLEEDEQSELIFDSSFTIDSVFTNTIFSETA